MRKDKKLNTRSSNTKKSRQLKDVGMQRQQRDSTHTSKPKPEKSYLEERPQRKKQRWRREKENRKRKKRLKKQDEFRLQRLKKLRK